MGTAAVAAIIVRREKDLVERFRAGQATSASSAKTPESLGVHTRVAWDRLSRRAVIREGAPGAYYLDEPTWDALRHTRRRLALVLFAIVLVLGVISTWVISQ